MNYLRLKKDEQFKKNIEIRAKVLQQIRKFFDADDFLEVQTPLCVKLPGMEPYLHPFKTFVADLKGQKHDAYLITSPEYAMKKLLVGGMEKIYQMSSCFRSGEQWGGRHNPEFTLLEWYRTGGDYQSMIVDTINLMRNICEVIHGSSKFVYQSVEFDCNNVEVITVRNAMLQYAGLEMNDLFDIKELREVCVERGYVQAENLDDIIDTWDDLFFKIFITEVEPHLGKEKITVLKDFPAPLAALAKRREDDSRYAERFEIYCGGLELCNGFSELTDTNEQRQRFEEEYALRKQLGKDMYDIDESFLNALQLGMPESGGNALGVDRLVMLMTDSSEINDVLLFPASDIFDE